jgi:hypothetical protein
MESLERLVVEGVPAVVFLDGRGRERGDLRLASFVPPAGLLTGSARSGARRR